MKIHMNAKEGLGQVITDRDFLKDFRKSLVKRLEDDDQIMALRREYEGLGVQKLWREMARAENGLVYGFVREEFKNFREEKLWKVMLQSEDTLFSDVGRFSDEQIVDMVRCYLVTHNLFYEERSKRPVRDTREIRKIREGLELFGGALEGGLKSMKIFCLELSKDFIDLGSNSALQMADVWQLAGKAVGRVYGKSEARQKSD
jgi:hypothetical protein